MNVNPKTRSCKEAYTDADELQQTILDSFETPVGRPSQKERQRRVY
jgi:hypothetical protein